MNRWTKHVIIVREFPVKLYVRNDNKQAYIFPLFGRYNGLYSDANVLDFATDFLLGNENNIVSFQGYMNSFEDTAVIQIDKVA